MRHTQSQRNLILYEINKNVEILLNEDPINNTQILIGNITNYSSPDMAQEISDILVEKSSQVNFLR